MISLLGGCPKELKAGSGRDIRTPLFPATLFLWPEGGAAREPMGGRVEQTRCTDNGTLLSLTKEGSSDLCCNTDEPADIVLSKVSSS